MKHLVGDVSSAARILPDLNGEALFVARAKGAYLWDDQGRQYIDTALGFGAVLLGHAHDAVTASVIDALNDAPAPSWAHVREHAAASALAKHTGDLSKVIFNNSGSEAVHLACRAARAYTGRKKIAKMAAGFDGWFDEITLGNVAGSDADFEDGARPCSERMTLLRFNDFDDVGRLFAEHDDIAAIIMEPMLANAGCLMAAPGYLEHVEAVARQHGALVIADEVLMGFRLHAGLSSQRQGLRPDLATVGKAIGSGVPVSALVGRPEILEGFEQGRVLRGGTFSGNPMACAALSSTLATLDQADYAALAAAGDDLRAHIVRVFAQQGVAVSTSGYGTVFTIWPCAQAPKNYREALRVASKAFSTELHLVLRELGLLIMPSPFGRLYVSFDHTAAVIDEMKAIFSAAALRMKSTQYAGAIAL
ncbi:aspartate aminotransferase family protein [Paraburkholderia bannensis]|uniref:aspartate aminotransferase family protein n=1 Tax=Paraburkholderia bannensis TaxID=765414 RepID=UPI002AB62532|nr:aminotransferase class III-fold pyridoxal phosphate-dependent enzyme [Paraburkholderia bannensis]